MLVEQFFVCEISRGLPFSEGIIIKICSFTIITSHQILIKNIIILFTDKVQKTTCVLQLCHYTTLDKYTSWQCLLGLSWRQTLERHTVFPKLFFHKMNSVFLSVPLFLLG